MKKFVVFLSVIFLCALVSSAVIMTRRSIDVSVFASNVEALAKSEVGGSGSMCSQSGNEGGGLLYEAVFEMPWFRLLRSGSCGIL